MTLRELAVVTVRSHMRWPKHSHPEHNQRCVDNEQALYTAIDRIDGLLDKVERCLSPIGSYACVERAFEYIEELREVIEGPKE